MRHVRFTVLAIVVAGAVAAMAINVVQVSASGGVGFPTPGARILQTPPITTDAPPSPMVFAVYRPMTGPTFMSPPEPLLLANTVDPSASWTASTLAPWLVLSPESGAGPGVLTLSLNAAVIAGMAGSTYPGTVEITSPVAPQSPRQVSVVLRITPAPGSANSAPIGVLDTPPPGATGLSGAIPITGWALDDAGITRIHIYRAAVAGEPPGNVFIGDAIKVRGVRPDLTLSHPDLPEIRSGGWGLMVLSNMLPNGGNGPITFRVYVNDGQGIQNVLVGESTVTFDNANAVKPFGTIDFPPQGGAVSGTMLVQGWVLAQPHPGRFVPFDGSTIRLFIDGVEVPASATYGVARPDVAALFPPANYANANGPGVQFTVDTTLLTNGLHTIAWVVTDNMGAADGIGSRFFTVQNGGS